MSWLPILCLSSEWSKLFGYTRQIQRHKDKLPCQDFSQKRKRNVIGFATVYPHFRHGRILLSCEETRLVSLKFRKLSQETKLNWLLKSSKKSEKITSKLTLHYTIYLSNNRLKKSWKTLLYMHVVPQFCPCVKPMTILKVSFQSFWFKTKFPENINHPKWHYLLFNLQYGRRFDRDFLDQYHKFW